MIQPPKNRPRLSAPEASVRASHGRVLSDEESEEEDNEPIVKKKRIQRRTKSEVAMLWSDGTQAYYLSRVYLTLCSPR